MQKPDKLRITFLDKTFQNTKRGLLSSIYPILKSPGIVCLIEPNLIKQELWKSKVNCDDELPSDLKYQFQQWQSQLRYSLEFL